MRKYAPGFMPRKADVRVEEVGLQIDVLQKGRWAMSGFPTINVTHRAACAWMATTIAPEHAAEMVKPPWHAFVIRVPNQLLWVANARQEPVEVRLISAARLTDEDRWFYTIASEPTDDGGNPEPAPVTLWAYNVSTAAMVGAQMPMEPTHWLSMPKQAIDDRTEELCRRLIIGVCLHYSSPERLAERRTRPLQIAKVPREAQRGMPTFDLWEMRSGVSVDVVQAMKHFARTGDGSSPKVQGLVGGHGKWQVHGPGRSLRKYIHVEPYWRGREDAPVSARVKGE